MKVSESCESHNYLLVYARKNELLLRRADKRRNVFLCSGIKRHCSGTISLCQSSSFLCISTNSRFTVGDQPNQPKPEVPGGLFWFSYCASHLRTLSTRVTPILHNVTPVPKVTLFRVRCTRQKDIQLLVSRSFRLFVILLHFSDGDDDGLLSLWLSRTQYASKTRTNNAASALMMPLLPYPCLPWTIYVSPGCKSGAWELHEGKEVVPSARASFHHYRSHHRYQQWRSVFVAERWIPLPFCLHLSTRFREDEIFDLLQSDDRFLLYLELFVDGFFLYTLATLDSIEFVQLLPIV